MSLVSGLLGIIQNPYDPEPGDPCDRCDYVTCVCDSDDERDYETEAEYAAECKDEWYETQYDRKGGDE